MTDLWTSRARAYGRRSVVGLPVPEEEIDQVTKEQEDILIPLLTQEMTGRAQKALDFGCGYGRFTPALCELADEVAGYDPCAEILEYAPVSRATYETGPMEIFFRGKDERYDLIWIVHVLGGIPDPDLFGLADNLVRILAPGGLLFIADNATDPPFQLGYWRSRREQDYGDLFVPRGINLRVVGRYTALGNPMSVFAGRKA